MGSADCITHNAFCWHIQVPGPVLQHSRGPTWFHLVIRPSVTMATGLAEQVNENEWVRFPFPVGVLIRATLTCRLLFSWLTQMLIYWERKEEKIVCVFALGLTWQHNLPQQVPQFSVLVIYGQLVRNDHPNQCGQVSSLTTSVSHQEIVE